ncbi:MAG: methyltransferase domain-containing protein [Candidatus Bathyarchaeia archaeon]
MAWNKYKRILKHFERRVATYGTSVETYYDMNLIDLCWSVLPKKNYDCVLDLAAGQGDFFALLFSGVPKPETVFLDISKSMLAKGVERGIISPARAIIANPDHNLPFLDCAFDLVLCRYAWHDFRRQKRVAKEINRILKVGGVFLFVDMSLPDNVNKTILRVYRKLHTLKTTTPSYILNFGQLKNIMEQAQLHLLDFRWYTSFVSISDWVKENQITSEQRERIFDFVLHNEWAQYFVRNIERKEKDIEFKFPVLIASFEKP